MTFVKRTRGMPIAALGGLPKGGLGSQSTPRHQLPALIAKREGTRGFRAPEVLMQCAEQGPPLDVWSAGVILLCLLSRRYPAFDAPHDLHALAEIVLLVGPAAAAAGAAAQKRTLSLVRPHAFAAADGGTTAAPPPWRSLVVGWEGDADADAAAAVELLAACLRFDPAQRPTAAEALRFAFFASE